MSSNNNRILELFRKYLSNTISESEEQEFLGYVEDPLSKKQIKELLTQAFNNQTEITSLSHTGRERILKQILKTDSVRIKVRKNNNLWIRIAVAASVLLCLSITLYIYRLSSEKPVVAISSTTNNTEQDSAKTYLTLANGDRIALSDVKDGQIATQSGITITKAKDGQLVYSIDDNKVNSTEYNTIQTPKGEQYQINLPDGTKVWLNAASSLKYPTSFFLQKERKVTLTGEGYFEVAKDKTKPFIVATEKQEVEVLGTHFNINAYNDHMTKTTLLEGSVKVSVLNNSESSLQVAVLKPGQMAVNNYKEINISDVPYSYNEIAWKDGYFVFSNANIKDIMRDLSNWYNLEVEYEGDMSNIYFQGNYLRSRDVFKLLKSIESTNKVKFKIAPGNASGKGRRVTVIEKR